MVHNETRDCICPQKFILIKSENYSMVYPLWKTNLVIIRFLSFCRQFTFFVGSWHLIETLLVYVSSSVIQIKAKVVLGYLSSMGVIAVLTIFFFMSLYQGLNIYSNFWLTYWTEDPLLKNKTNAGSPDFVQKTYFYLIMYFVIGLVQGTLYMYG